LDGLEAQKSSHGQAELGPHTEHASNGFSVRGASSPAVDAICLAGLRNPKAEPTGFALLEEVLAYVPRESHEILARPIFGIDPPDSTTRKDTVWGVPILQRRRGRYEVAYRDDKVRTAEDAKAQLAITHLRLGIEKASRSVLLTPGRAWLARNPRTFHWRDKVRSRDRWLIRIFGFSPTTPVILPDVHRPELVGY
jgi:hypothetical protein